MSGDHWGLDSASAPDWATFRGSHDVDGVTWLWADNDGPHLEQALPADAPVATHLWAWGVGRLGRFRLDGGRVLGAWLVQCSDPDPSLQVSDPVSVLAWSDRDRRVSLLVRRLFDAYVPLRLEVREARRAGAEAATYLQPVAGTERP